MRADETPHRRKWRSRDPWLLLLAIAAWMSMGWWPFDARVAALPGLGLTLLLCKTLAMPPILRALVAPLSAFVSLQWLDDAGRFAFAGALLAASAYLAFTIARRGVHFVRGWRFRTADGNTDGWDYDRWLVARERLHARLWPWPRPRRILFPPTNMEAALREGFRHRRDRLTFAEATTETIDAHDLVVPLTLADARQLRGFESRLGRNPLPLPAASCIALCNDKLACNRALAAAGFADCVPAIGDALPFPYVLKKRIDAWGVNTHIVAGVDDERRLAALLRHPDYFLQAFVPGQREYAAHLLVRRGRIVAAVTVEYGFAHELHKKCREQPPHYRRLRRPAHLSLFRDMLAAIGYEGLCCVNYKLEGGRVRLLEINPRFGASLAPWFFAMVRALPRAPGPPPASSRTKPDRARA